MSAKIEFISSMIEVLSVYGVLLILDRKNILSHLNLLTYVVIASLLATGLSILNIPYYFVLIVGSYIILMKVFLKKPIAEITADVICANACVFAIEFLLTIFLSLFHIYILENKLLLFGCLICVYMGIRLLNKWNRFVTKIQNIYFPIRMSSCLVVINMFLSITILLNIWYNFRNSFYSEKWELFGLIACNYIINIGFIIISRKQRHTSAEFDAYKTYGEYLEEISEQLRSQRHEFNNQIQTIIGFAETASVEDCSQMIIQYCNQLVQKKNTSMFLFSKEAIINAILFDKIKLAMEKEVCFQHIVHAPLSENEITPQELSELLNNLLNNAFEAVYDLPRNERLVNLAINGNKIEVLNFVPDEFDEKSVLLFDKRGYSTKGECRGYGLSNIKTIIGNYNGTIKINKNGNILCVEVLFQ